MPQGDGICREKSWGTHRLRGASYPEMKLALFGASGMIGSRILSEALRRGHEVTAVVRDPAKFAHKHNHLTVVKGDVLDAAGVARIAKGHDAVLSAVGPAPEVVKGAAHSLIDGLTQAGVRRLVVVGGASSLEVSPGVQLIDTPLFPKEVLPVARAHGAALATLRKNKTLDWTSVSPAAMIAPGERTGKFRLGKDQLVTDAKGESRISAEDYAIAFLDEAEHPQHLHQRFTAAY